MEVNKRYLVITRTPLRISLLGGGTDFPEYYRQHGGKVLSLTVDKYIYVAVRRRWDSSIGLGGAVPSLVRSVDDIEHGIIRESLRLTGITNGVDVVSMSDVPASGTGLGSSSAFAVGLLHCLHATAGHKATKGQLAEMACRLEIEKLSSPIGKQDQYAASYGGCNEFAFKTDDSVEVSRVNVPRAIMDDLERHTLLFSTGQFRRAAAILHDQRSRIPEVLEHLDALKEYVDQGRDLLLRGDFEFLGRLLDISWQRKRQLSDRICNDQLDRWYRDALQAGAFGGKLLGAGGGGYFLSIAPPARRQAIADALHELTPMPIRFESAGSTVVGTSGPPPG